MERAMEMGMMGKKAWSLLTKSRRCSMFSSSCQNGLGWEIELWAPPWLEVEEDLGGFLSNSGEVEDDVVEQLTSVL